MYFVAAGAHLGSLPRAVLEVRVAPVDATRPVGLAYAGLLRVGATVGADLADKAAHAAIRLSCYFQPSLEQEVEAADAVSSEGYAVRAGAAIGELHNDARVVFRPLSLCAGGAASSYN